MPDGCLNASTSSNSPSYSIRSTPSPLRLRRRSTPWHPLSCCMATKAAADSAAALVAIQRHTWYLTEDCISIALFNPDLEDSEEKNKLAQILESYQQHNWRSKSQHYLQFLPALRSLILLENAPSSYSPSLRWTTNNSFFKRTGKKQINMMLPEKLFQIFILLMTLQKGL